MIRLDFFLALLLVIFVVVQILLGLKILFEILDLYFFLWSLKGLFYLVAPLPPISMNDSIPSAAPQLNHVPRWYLYLIILISKELFTSHMLLFIWYKIYIYLYIYIEIRSEISFCKLHDFELSNYFFIFKPQIQWNLYKLTSQG